MENKITAEEARKIVIEKQRENIYTDLDKRISVMSNEGHTFAVASSILIDKDLESEVIKHYINRGFDAKVCSTGRIHLNW
jgi:hypothetical protein